MTDPFRKMAEDPSGYWNEQAGEQWVAQQDRLDAIMAPIAERLLEAAAPQAGEHVVDVGCGCGGTTRMFSERVGPEGRVTGVDVANPMITRAREMAAGQDNLAFHVASALALNAVAEP